MAAEETKRNFIIFVIFAFVVSLVATIIFYSQGRKLFYYPTGTVALSLFLSLILIHYDHVSDPWVRVNIDRRFLDIGLLLIFAVLSLYTGPRHGFPPEYFIILLFSVLFLVFHIEYVGSYSTLGFILIFSIIIRANIWYSSPHYSKDPRLHEMITGYIREVGRMVPPAVDDYYDYPIADLLSGIVSILTKMDSKHALFFSMGMAGIVGIYFIYLFIKRVFSDDTTQLAAYAALLSSISAYNLVLTSGLKPQTVSATFLIMVVFVNELTSSVKRTLLVVLLAIVMIFTHPLAPIVLSGILFVYFLTNVLTDHTKKRYQIEYSPSRKLSGLLGAAIMFLMIFRRFEQVGHLRIQILRIRSAFITSDPSGLPDFAGSGGRVTTSHILLSLDHLLLQAGTLLVFALLSSIGWIAYIYFRIFKSSLDVVKDEWLVGSLVLFGGFSIFFVGRAPTVRRAAPAVMGVTIILVIYAIYCIRHRWGQMGKIVIALIIISGAFLGVANPGVYITNRSSGFEPLIYESELAMIDHFSQHSQNTGSGNITAYSDGYTSTSVYVEHIEAGDDTSKNTFYSEFVQPKDYRNIDSRYIKNVLSQREDSIYLYRTYYKKFTGLKPPPKSNVVYTSGRGKLLS